MIGESCEYVRGGLGPVAGGRGETTTRAAANQQGEEAVVQFHLQLIGPVGLYGIQ